MKKKQLADLLGVMPGEFHKKKTDSFSAFIEVLVSALDRQGNGVTPTAKEQNALDEFDRLLHESFAEEAASHFQPASGRRRCQPMPPHSPKIESIVEKARKHRQKKTFKEG